MAIFYPVEIDSYNHYQFAIWLTEYFNNHPCPLCHKIHEVEIFQYKDRNIDPHNNKKKIVIRTRCKDNQKKREETGEKIQYTITILPGFLIPHSRVVIPNLFKALEKYLNEEITQQQAALLMNCNSRHSFNLYYRRFSSLFCKWISFLSGILQQQKLVTEVNWNVKRKWNRFIALINKLKIDKMIKRSPEEEMFFRFKYVHSLLDGNKMSLGP